MRNIRISYTDVKGQLNRYFNFCIGAGRAGEIMRHVPMLQLEQAVKECGFRYIRFHGIFHEDMAVCTRGEDGKLAYNFQYTDMLFDDLLSIGIRPFLELSFMPKCMASGEQTLFFWNTNVTPPADYAEWDDFIRAFVLHLTERYGEEELRQWYFEVWNEPNHPAFFSKYKEIEAYFELYRHTVAAIKSVCTDYRVGGPSSAGLGWFEELYTHCQEKDVPLDFISGHHYCVRGDFDKDGKKELFLCDRGQLIHPICHWAAHFRQKGLPLHITEWSSSFSPRDPVHDTYINAPLVLDAIRHLDGFPDSLSYWTYTDIFEEIAPPPTPFHGGFGLFNTQSLPKPTYHAFRFLNDLGETELSCDDANAYATRDERGVQVLLWNYVRQDQGGLGNRDFFKRLIPAKAADRVEMTLTELPNGTYTVRIERVGYQMGDVYSAYLNGDFGDLASLEKTAQLRAASEPETTEYTAQVRDGCFTLSLDCLENEVDMIRLDRME